MNLKLAMTAHAFQATPIFRSVSDTHSGAVLHTPAGDRRPVRIPLEVDNIWEWARQPQFPSRRSCAFGSPSGTLAAASGPADGRVCRVLIKPPAQVIQLRGIPDARGHPDLHALRAVLRAHEENASPERADIGMLRTHFLSGEQTQALLAGHPDLMIDLKESVRYWQDCFSWDTLNPETIDSSGEIAFIAPHGYVLDPTT